LYQDALDMLAMPATAVECERAYSSAKEMINSREESIAGGKLSRLANV
jgi:hypothetical protein